MFYAVFFTYIFVSDGFNLRVADSQGYSKTRDLDGEELLEQLPALQKLLYRLIGCRVLFFISSVSDVDSSFLAFVSWLHLLISELSCPHYLFFSQKALLTTIMLYNMHLLWYVIQLVGVFFALPKLPVPSGKAKLENSLPSFFVMG